MFTPTPAASQPLFAACFASLPMSSALVSRLASKSSERSRRRLSKPRRRATAQPSSSAVWSGTARDNAASSRASTLTRHPLVSHTRLRRRFDVTRGTWRFLEGGIPDSLGFIFFKQKRNGLNYKEFYCYKFRSMRLNEIADLHQVSKNDPRITKVGKFIRKTSIDELPQFFNVLLGDMSVVGPRPHMVSHTEMYARRIDKFMVRHFIKPGITGLAQTKGFRGEVESDKDIIYRVKFDIFYLENWSLLLDIKIIFLTVINAIKGEEKAY